MLSAPPQIPLCSGAAKPHPHIAPLPSACPPPGKLVDHQMMRITQTSLVPLLYKPKEESSIITNASSPPAEHPEGVKARYACHWCVGAPLPEGCSGARDEGSASVAFSSLFFLVLELQDRGLSWQ